MKNAGLLIIFFVSLMIFMFLGSYFAFQTRANAINLNLKIKLQGVFQPGSQLKLKIDLYNSTGRVAQFTNIMLSASEQGYFTGLVILDQNLDMSVPYAIFIKPENYLGQLFCSPTKSGSNCQYPEFIFTSSATQLDLSDKVFYSGDLAPQDGKVDSADLSKIFANIGKQGPTGDINLDGIVNGIDYTLAQKTLSLNKRDDVVSLETPIVPTTTITSTITPTAAPTNNPTPHPTNSPTPTISPTPTSVPQSGRGRCTGVVSGQVRISYLGQSECRILNENDYRCVDSASECTNALCVDFTKTAIREGVARCGYGLATFDETSPISCQATYSPDASCQNPIAPTSCDDNRALCP